VLNDALQRGTRDKNHSIRTYISEKIKKRRKGRGGKEVMW
jgi:hypothetical protein